MKVKMEGGGLPLHLCHSSSVSPVYPPLRVLFLVFAIFMSCLAPSSRACRKPFQCGNQTFKYPFGRKNSGCGDPALQLDCDDRKVGLPLINITGYQYYILYSAEDHIVRIIDKNQWWERCNPLVSNHTRENIGSGPQFTVPDEINMNLTLWEECPPQAIEDKLVSPLPCNDHWYFNPSEGSDLTGVCNSNVTFPIPHDSFRIYNYSWEAILHAGFLIRWEVNETCTDCEHRGGFCAYNIDSREIYCHGSKNQSRTLIIGLAIGGAVLTAAAVVVFFIYNCRRRKASSTRGVASDFSNYQGTDIEKGQKGYMVGPSQIFTYQELQHATNFFDEKNELGDGGFGAVYLGKLEDGRTVAVKRLYQENSRRFEQFINEVEILSSVDHPNLVRLYGCSSPESPMLLLVYEFVQNGTLADHLHGSRRSLTGLPWGTRLKIALQTAVALAYLHNIDPPIFHRDVKSNNILLDEYLGAKVADFGLSRLVPVNVSHVTTAPQGTPGYVDPEYHQCFQLTEKSDVYSFGVVLVELISAKVAVDIMRNRNEISLANMAIDKIRRGVLNELVDPDLKIESNHEVKAMVIAVAELAFECLSRERDFRPCMKEVVARLEQITEMQQKSTESSKLMSFSLAASPLSVPIMGTDRSGQHWFPLSL